jgi:hypothetical protein
MGPTLVRPSRRRSSEGVAGRVADIAGRAPGTVARMRSLGAAEAQRRASWGGLACEDRQRQRMGRLRAGRETEAGTGCARCWAVVVVVGR